MKMARIVYRPLPPECEYEDPTKEEIEAVRLVRNSLMRLLDEELGGRNALYSRLLGDPTIPDSPKRSLESASYDWTNVAFLKDAAK